MRRILQISNWIGLIVVSLQANAQISMNLVTNGPQTTQSCDGSIILTVSGVGNINALYPYMWPNPGGTTFIDTLTGAIQYDVCAAGPAPALSGVAATELKNDSCVSLVLLNVSGEYLGLPGFVQVSPLEQLDFDLTINLPSNINATDGSLIFSDNLNSNLSVRFFKSQDILESLLLYQLGHPTGPLLTTQVGSGMQATALDTGIYIIEVNQADTSYTSFAVHMEPYGTNTCELTPLLVYPQVTPASSSISCDGAVNTLTYGAGNSAAYFHSPFNQTTPYVQQLCEGLYEVTVSDSIGSVTVPYIIPSELGIINSYTGPFDPTWDTLYSAAIANCNIDYNQPVDSAIVTNVTWLDSVIVEVEWVFYQNGEDFVITQQQYVEEATMTVFSIAVYCENGRSALGYFFAVYPYDLTSQVTSIKNTTETHFSISPNPTSGIINIQSDDAKSFDVQIFDIHGRMVLNTQSHEKNESLIDLKNQPNGFYVVRCTSKNRSFAQRVLVLK